MEAQYINNDFFDDVEYDDLVTNDVDDSNVLPFSDGNYDYFFKIVLFFQNTVNEQVAYDNIKAIESFYKNLFDVYADEYSDFIHTTNIKDDSNLKSIERYGLNLYTDGSAERTNHEEFDIYVLFNYQNKNTKKLFKFSRSLTFVNKIKSKLKTDCIFSRHIGHYNPDTVFKKNDSFQINSFDSTVSVYNVMKCIDDSITFKNILDMDPGLDGNDSYRLLSKYDGYIKNLVTIGEFSLNGYDKPQDINTMFYKVYMYDPLKSYRVNSNYSIDAERSFNVSQDTIYKNLKKFILQTRFRMFLCIQDIHGMENEYLVCVFDGTYVNSDIDNKEYVIVAETNTSYNLKKKSCYERNSNLTFGNGAILLTALCNGNSDAAFKMFQDIQNDLNDNEDEEDDFE